MKTFFSRLAGSLVLVLVLSTGLHGEVRVTKNFDEQNGLTFFKMTVTPAAEPTPALKHRMWLRPHKLQPGNAAMHYVRSFAENSLRRKWRGLGDRYGEEVDKWYDHEIAIEDLPLDDVRDASAAFDTTVEQFIQPGSRCRDSDWGLEFEDLRGPETITFLLPDFQESRSIARMLALRTRLAIAEQRYDDAIEHLRMQFRLGQDVGQEMFLVCNLVGIAIEGVAHETAIDLIAAPDSPNLYWALAEVPTPLVDCRKAVRLEMSLGTRIFPALMDAETAEHSPQEWARLFREGIVVFGKIGGIEGFEATEPLGGILSGFTGLSVSMVAYPAAKQRLMDAGMATQRVEKMPVGQVMMVDAAREYRRVADEVEKWWYVPYTEARARQYEAEQSLREDSSPLNAGRTIAQLLLPAVRVVRKAQMRSGWIKNALLVVEALRMHAAERGEFPESLDQIQVVPVPLNPITAEPYVYHLEGNTAVLELPFSDGMNNQAWRFEITLAKP